MAKYTREDILRIAEEEDVEFIRLQFTDMFGTMKNIVDIVSVCTAALLSLLCMGKLEGVGIGSVMAMLGVGRVIALYNNLTKNIQLEPQPQETEESEERQHKAKYSRADI